MILLLSHADTGTAKRIGLSLPILTEEKIAEPLTLKDGEDEDISEEGSAVK